MVPMEAAILAAGVIVETFPPPISSVMVLLAKSHVVTIVNGPPRVPPEPLSGIPGAASNLSVFALYSMSGEKVKGEAPPNAVTDDPGYCSG